jgi:hypothetical protein
MEICFWVNPSSIIISNTINCVGVSPGALPLIGPDLRAVFAMGSF